MNTLSSTRLQQMRAFAAQCFCNALPIFQRPRFNACARVNRFLQGSIDRVDGRVVAQTDEGVLVEWPRFGAGWERPQTLCEQV